MNDHSAENSKQWSAATYQGQEVDIYKVAGTLSFECCANCRATLYGGEKTNTLYLPLSLARASISSKKTMDGATARAFLNTCEQQ